MPKLSNGKVCIDIRVTDYYYVRHQQIQEYHYNCQVLVNNKPIILGQMSDKQNPNFDFELDDEMLSSTFLSALNTNSTTEIGFTYDGEFNLIISPNQGDFELKIEIGSHYFGLPSGENLLVTIELFVTKQEMEIFCQQLIQEENYYFTQKGKL